MNAGPHEQVAASEIGRSMPAAGAGFRRLGARGKEAKGSRGREGRGAGREN